MWGERLYRTLLSMLVRTRLYRTSIVLLLVCAAYRHYLRSCLRDPYPAFSILSHSQNTAV